MVTFKSAGRTRQQRIETTLSSSVVPIGIASPLRLGTDGNVFAMHTTFADQINDNLRNLILTNWGDRLILHDFGANLRDVLSEMTSQDDFDARAMANIQGAVNRWMPHVSLSDFRSEIDRTALAATNGLSVVKITLTYNVPVLNLTDRKLEVTMYAM